MFTLEWYNYAEMGALLVCLFLWPRLRQTDFWPLMPYLVFIVVLELVSGYMGKKLDMRVGWIFNISIPLEVLFYSYLFRRQLQQPLLKQLVYFFMIAVTVFALVYNVFFWQVEFQSIFLKISTVSMITLSCLYFIDILRREVPVNVMHQPMFWIAIGLIIFNAGELALSLYFDWLRASLTGWRRVYRLINNNLNIFLYLMLSIGAIIAVWKRKSA